jgi:hypothetical protein
VPSGCLPTATARSWTSILQLEGLDSYELITMTHSCLAGGRHTGASFRREGCSRMLSDPCVQQSSLTTTLAVGRCGAVGHIQRSEFHSICSDTDTLYMLYIEDEACIEGINYTTRPPRYRFRLSATRNQFTLHPPIYQHVYYPASQSYFVRPGRIQETLHTPTKSSQTIKKAENTPERQINLSFYQETS